jgi:hypothetical protein
MSVHLLTRQTSVLDSFLLGRTMKPSSPSTEKPPEFPLSKKLGLYDHEIKRVDIKLASEPPREFIYETPGLTEAQKAEIQQKNANREAAWNALFDLNTNYDVKVYAIPDDYNRPLLAKADYTRDGFVNKDEVLATKEIVSAKIESLRNALKDDSLNGRLFETPYTQDVREALMNTLMDLNKQSEQIDSAIADFDNLASQYGDASQVSIRTFAKVAAGVDLPIEKTVNTSNSITQGISKKPARIDFKPIKLSEDEYFGIQDLKDLIPLMQKADQDKDGIVTKKELTLYKENLLKEREELSKLGTDKLVMDAIAAQRLQMAKEKATRDIDHQVKQIDKLFVKDAKGVDLFDKLASQIGDADGISINKAITAIVSAMG